MKDLRDSLTMLWVARVQLCNRLLTRECELYGQPAHDAAR